MIDLHIHTSATPHHATWTPETLAAAAARAGLRVIAVTDHNTTACVRATQEAGARYGIQVVSGVEIDSGFPAGRSDDVLPFKIWHVLVYGVDPDTPQLQALCRSVEERNRADAAALRHLLSDAGFRLTGIDDLERPPNVAEIGMALGRSNNLPDRLPGDDDESAGMRYILTRLPGVYRPPAVDEITAVAHVSGGVAVLAHPGRSKGVYAIPATAEDIAAMAAAGLDGIEVYYPTHRPDQVMMYVRLAQQHGLLVTGGSDSHHPHQPLAQWPVAWCRAFLERLGIENNRITK
ncbi:MAG: PHP domain-containing protein [Roseiflexaceae bacterium]|nr:PHP domain-containing protein [Roseiflexaceae bacterium]